MKSRSTGSVPIPLVFQSQASSPSLSRSFFGPKYRFLSTGIQRLLPYTIHEESVGRLRFGRDHREYGIRSTTDWWAACVGGRSP